MGEVEGKNSSKNLVLGILSHFDINEEEGKRNIVIAAALIIGVTGASLLLFGPLQGSQNAQVVVLVKNAEGSALWKAQVNIKSNQTNRALSGEISLTTDREGKASFSDLLVGSEISIVTSKKGFASKVKTIKIAPGIEELTVVLEPELENSPQSRTITFVGPNGVRLEGKTINVALSCSSGVLVENPARIVVDGRLDVAEPGGCETLVAKVNSSGFEENSYNLKANQVVSLANLAAVTGEARIIVKDSEGKFVESAQVTIIDSQGIFVENGFTNFGEVTFTLEVGEYTAKISDSAEEFAQSEAGFVVERSRKTNVNTTLSAKPVATVAVKVVDRQSREVLKNSKIIIDGPIGLVENPLNGYRQTKDFFGKEITVGFPSEGIYRITSSADGYSVSDPVTIDTSKDKGEKISIELSKCTAATCEVLRIKVIDEDSLPVSNARIALTFAQNNFFAQEYGLKYTNSDGVAVFSNLKNGSYIALAQKFPAQGKSTQFEVREGSGNEVTINLVIGKGTVEIEAVDTDSRPVSFGFAAFKSNSEQLGSIALDAQGKAQIELKADKHIFVSVSADGYSTYNSESLQIVPGKTSKIKAKLSGSFSAQKPTIEFAGLFDEQGSEQKNLISGKGYNAKFRFAVPKDLSFEQAGIFVRVGKENSALQDNIYISAINAPGAGVVKGSTYSAPRGSEEDNDNITNGEAKWANIVWDSIEEGIYEISLEISVKESVSSGEFIPLFYRSFGIISNGKVLRDPLDPELKDSEDVNSKHGMYAESYSKEFYEGAQEECDASFCYSERVLDKKEGLNITKPYQTRIFGDYSMQFTITNNSQSIHRNARLSVKNSLNNITTDNKLALKSYKIKNADSEDFSSQNETFDIGQIELGNFSRNKSVSGTLELKPAVVSQTALSNRIISDQQLVFDKFVAFSVVAQKDLNVNIFPQTIPALTEFDLIVQTRLISQDEILEIVDAAIRIDVISPDRTKAVFRVVTDNNGSAIIKMTPLLPGTKVNVSVEKDGYAARKFSFSASSSVVFATPSRIGSLLDITSKNEEKIPVQIRNLIPLDLEIKNTRLRGNFSGLLDVSKINNWLDQYEGSEIRKDSSASIILLTSVSEDAKLLDEPKKIKASLVVEVGKKDSQTTWALEIPVEIVINLAEPPKSNNCIEISLKEWKDATLGGNAATEFYIKNNCILQTGKPLNLHSLKAKIEWTGNRAGNVELHVTDPDSRTEASEVLTEGAFSDLLEGINGGKEYIALLEFTPRGGTIGSTAQFKVIIDAAQQTNAGEQLVGSSNAIESEIDIIDLGECIKYTPDAQAGLILQKTDEEGRIDIDSSACGNIEIDMWLCKDDIDCSGGVEGAIKVSPEKFTLTPRTPKKSIIVSRQAIPGMYGMGVHVKTPSSNYREIAVVDVLVKPSQKDAFELFKYEFSLKGKNSADSTELKNNYFIQRVMVDASICDWGQATEKGWFDWKFAGIGAVYGALQGIQPAMKAAQTAAKTTANASSKSLQAAKTGQQTSSASNQVTKTNAESVCTELQATQSAVAPIQGECAAVPAGAAAGAHANTAMGRAVASCNEMKAENSATEAADKATNTDIGIGAGDVLDQFLTSGAVGAAGEYEIYESIAMFVATGLDPALITSVAGTSQNQARATKQQAQLETIAGELQSTAAEMQAAASIATAQCAIPGGQAACACVGALQYGAGSLQSSVAEVQSYATQVQKTGIDTTATLGLLNGAQASISTSFNSITPALTAAQTTSTVFTPGTIMGAYTLGGFFIGGVLGGLFGGDACAQRHSSELPDYMINLLEDASEIESEREQFSFEYAAASAQVIGKYEEQRIGLKVVNRGIENPKPVYSTVKFGVKQHLHSDPTKISRGNSNFGPFNLPDSQLANIEPKLHLKFKTQEVEEELPDLSFDTLSCVSGNKIGRTGSDALPRVKLDWGFGGEIGKDACIDNENGVYCDATQFSIMLSKRLNLLREFFEANPVLTCPDNPLSSDLGVITQDLNVAQTTNSCYITSFSGYLEGDIAIKGLIEANENRIFWTKDIPDKDAFYGMVHFNALLMQDGFSDDFKRDFSRHYSGEKFFDTPDWFYNISEDSRGEDYGVGRLFEQQAISFTNRFFESSALPSAGKYEVLISIVPNNGGFAFFDSSGKVNADIKVEFYLLSEPNPNSAFYSVPIDGLVGLTGDTFSRQGYGTSFENASDEYISINSSSQPVKSYNDTGSNPIVSVNSEFDKSFYSLNTSPAKRGELFEVERISGSQAVMRLSPSKATPVMLKVLANNPSEDLSVFYTLNVNEVPIDIGLALTFWDGAGACLDPAGVIITESYDFRSDRAARAKDPVLNWQAAYAVDFGEVNYTGDAYLRTIFYTDPEQQVVLSIDYPSNKAQLLTPDERGQKVRLAGVSGISFNNPSGGSTGNISSLSEIFSLVSDGKVCVTDSGRKASFFWNPKAVYEMQGLQTNISEFTNSLVPGNTCIGLG